MFEITGLAAIGFLWNLGYGVMVGIEGVVGDVNPVITALVSLSVIRAAIVLIPTLCAVCIAVMS